jgi:hypothetical protein
MTVAAGFTGTRAGSIGVAGEFEREGVEEAAISPLP